MTTKVNNGPTCQSAFKANTPLLKKTWRTQHSWRELASNQHTFAHRHWGKHKGANEGNQRHFSMKEWPRPLSNDPLVVRLPFQHSPYSDLIKPINIIQYACEHKHCSQHLSSSGQNTHDLQFIALLTRFSLHSQNSCFSFSCWKFCIRLFVWDTMTFIVMNARHLGLSDMTRVNPLPHWIYSGVYWCIFLIPPSCSQHKQLK